METYPNVFSFFLYILKSQDQIYCRISETILFHYSVISLWEEWYHLFVPEGKHIAWHIGDQ